MTCPDCLLECTIDEESVDTFSCPGCGLLLYSGSGESGAAGAKAKAAVELSAGDLERTRHWQASLDEVLPTPDQLPRRLGRYELVELLGEGSFAQVYRALDGELGREVALKIPSRRRFTTPEHLKRFVDEARIAAKLEHPNIVRVYDIGWLSDDVCFIAMEYCGGGSLEQFIKAGPVPPERTAEIIADAAEAIHFAHLKGLVHRDLKPSNIMFGRDGRPRIVDFGLALPEEEQHDKAGEVAGTLPYMSPEQVRGDTHHLDGRTDIWSLGIVLYQMLAGRRPFTGNRQQLSAEILHREPKPLRQVNDAIPSALDEICSRCLRKRVAERWMTAKDLADSLRPFSQTAGITVLDSGATASKAAASRRQIARAVLAVGVSLLMLAVGIAAMSFGNRSGNQRSAIAGSSRDTSNDSKFRPLTALKVEQALPQDLVVGRIYNLLDVSPQPLAWPFDPRNGTWHYDDQRKDLAVDSATWGLLQMGSTSSKSFRLELGIEKRSGTGRIGVFFGLPPDKAEKPASGTRFQTLFLMRHSGDEGEIRRTVVEQLTDDQASFGIMDRKTLCAEVLSRPVPAELNLEIVIDDGALKTVRCNTVLLDELPDRRLPDRIPVTDYRGVFGIMNLSGNARIPYFRFTLLKKEQHE